MSKETVEWLNQQCLIGFTERRGTAWHYRASAQGIEPNHYPQGIPIEDIRRRLFSWEPVEQPIYVLTEPGLYSDGHVEADDFVVVPNKKAIVASDNGDVLGVFSDGYAPHNYDEWLLTNVASILDSDDLGIGSALLLRNRGVAAVQIEVPESFTTPDGVEYRPNILAATSLDGSLSTIYKRTVTDVVCDNTCERGLREEGQQYRLRHTRNSRVKLGDARDALQLIFESGDAFAEEVSRLVHTSVSEQQWRQVLNALVPIPEEVGRSQTNAANKRLTLNGLWAEDPRVEPWKNTAWGVAQAFNTYGQHYATVKGSHRAERNFDNVLSGKVAKSDDKVLTTLFEVIDRWPVPKQ